MSFFNSIRKIAGQTDGTQPYVADPVHAMPQKEDEIMNHSNVPQNGAYEAPYTNVGGNAMELRMVYPTNFAEVANIARDLMDQRTIVMNMENTPADLMRRLLDFLSGVAFCIGGQLQPIASKTYILTPKAIDVTGEKFSAQGQAQPQAQQAQSIPGAYPTFDPYQGR